MTGTESLYQKAARQLRESAGAARLAAEYAAEAADHAYAHECIKRAELYEAWAQRELQTERMMKDLADGDHDITA